MRRPLSRARIVAAALEVVDAEGLDALSMRRVAARLGVEAMSLYHHVANKEAIIEGLLDLLVAEADLPRGDVSATEWIRGTAEAFRRLAQMHPKAFPLLTSRPLPLVDPAAAEPLETGLAAFARLGMDPASAYAAVQAVSLSLLSLGMLESQVELNPDTDEASSLADLPEGQFPLLRAVPGLSVDQSLIWSSLVDALVLGLTNPVMPRG